VALLAVGRVALSFAVVQKNMETAAVVQQQSALRTQNTGLAAELARLTSTERLERAAAELGLQRPGDVRYLRAPQTLGSRDP
jgi:cell division protein FtsL